MYGESVFATMRMSDSQVLDWDLHFDRLKRGVSFLFGPFSQGDHFAEDLRERLENCWQREQGDKVLRLTLFRDQERRGLIRSGHSSVSDLRLHLKASPWDPDRSNDQPMNLRTCAAPQRPDWWPGYLKAGNYLETILAQKLFLKPGDDDLLFLSPSDTVTESSVANIFIVKNNKLFTAPSGPMVLEGVMRKKVIQLHDEYFSDCMEDASTLDQLYRSDAVFATNSLRGLMLVGKVDDQEIQVSSDLREKLNAFKKRLMHEKA